jgi:DNA-directed RNA polymerase subunit M/transcription elongation factor TFIIS
MSFCPKCDSILDINKQVAINKTPFSDELVAKLINGELTETDLTDIDIDSLSKNENYIKLDDATKEDANKRITKLMKKIGTSEGAIYICKNCGYTKPIKGRQLIMSKIGKSYSAVTHLTPDKIRIMINDKTLPHTRGYVCTNDKCISHTDIEKRDAVFFRFPNSLQVWYICTACMNYWSGK